MGFHKKGSGSPKLANNAKALFKKKQNKLAGKWKQAQEEAKTMGGGGIPDGRHIARLTGFSIKESSKGNIGLSTEWTVIRGESKGEKGFRWDSLEREEGLPYLAKFFNTLGLEIEELDVDAIDEGFKQLLKDKVCVRLRSVTKEGSEYANIYIDKVVNDPGEEDEGGEDAGGEDAGEAEGGTPEAGMVVTVTHKGKEKEGEIVEVDEKEETADVKLPGLKEPVTFKWDEMTPVEDEEGGEDGGEEDGEGDDEPEITIGSKVLVEHDGKEKEGTVKEINEKSETMMVQIPKVAKPVKFKFSEVAPIVEE